MSIVLCITLVSQKSGWISDSETNSVTFMIWYIKQQTCLAGHRQGSTFQQTQYTIATDFENSTEANFSIQ